MCDTRSNTSSRVEPLKLPVSWSTRRLRRPYPATGRKIPPALSKHCSTGGGASSSSSEGSCVTWSVAPLSSTQMSSWCQNVILWSEPDPWRPLRTVRYRDRLRLVRRQTQPCEDSHRICAALRRNSIRHENAYVPRRRHILPWRYGALLTPAAPPKLPTNMKCSGGPLTGAEPDSAR